MKKLSATLIVLTIVAIAVTATALAQGGRDDALPAAHGHSHALSDDREPGEDVRGNCDEAEHARDAACSAATTSSSSSRTGSATTGRRLVASVGSGFTISLKSASGAVVKTLRPGTYTVTVRDRSSEHNFHLSGPGVNKATGVAATSTSTWRIAFKRGTYAFKCDPHASMMRGAVRVR